MKRSRDLSHTPAMTVMDHVRELRLRLFYIAIVFIVGSVAAYMYRDWVIHLLLAPLGGEKLVYLNPAGGFNFIFLVSAYIGCAAATPVLIHQTYCFMRPLLSKKVQRYSGRILLSSLLLLISGAVFGYVFAIPGALHFLYGFATDYVNASLTADSYLGFVTAYTIGLGLVFQLPLLLLLFHWIKPFTPIGLLKSERWVILLSFIAAAIITPTPDPLNQTIIAVPIIVIYQFGAIAILLNIRKTRLKLKQAITPSIVPAVLPITPAIEPTPVAPPIRTVAQPQTISRPVVQSPKPSLLVHDGIFAPQSTSRRTLSTQPPQQQATRPISPAKRPKTRVMSLDGVSPIYGRVSHVM